MRPTRMKTAAIFPAVFFFLGASLQAKEPATEAVTLAVYNLRNYLVMERRVEGGVVAEAPKPEPEVRALLAGLTAIRPDLLGVCEMGDVRQLADLQERLRQQGIDLPHTELLVEAGGWNRNLAFLSRFPIVARNSRSDYGYELDGTRHAMQRGLLDVTVALNAGYHLRYVGLHLKSKREVPEGDQNLMRLHEARLARQHIDRILAEEPGVNLIVAGDFNDLRHEPAVRTIQSGRGPQGYLTALGLSDAYGFRWTHYWSHADSYARFDYVLHSSGMKGEIDHQGSHIYHWDEWFQASDHRPLVVKILPVDR